MIDQENPFASSRGPASFDGSSGPPVVKEDVEGNLALTAKIAKISAGVCIFFALFYAAVRASHSPPSYNCVANVDPSVESSTG
jgi:hypothetical protein